MNYMNLINYYTRTLKIPTIHDCERSLSVLYYSIFSHNIIGVIFWYRLTNYEMGRDN